MPAIHETRLEMTQLVFPEHANILGTLYGGRMMQWITTAATLASMRLARGQVVLGSMDSLDFHHPVRVGDLVILTAQVEAVGRSSMEVGVEVVAENPRSGDRRPATSSHLALVAVDEAGTPRPVGARVTPEGPAEAALHQAAIARKAARIGRLQDRAQQARDIAGELEPLPHSLEMTRIVFPEDAFAGSLMFAGKLMMDLDEVASIVAVRYARGTVVTASIDDLSFYAHIRVGQIVIYRAALNYVGHSSMEIGVKVLAEDALTGETHHTCTAFFTSVHVNASGKPVPLPPYVPDEPLAKKRWEEAETRRRVRAARLKNPPGLPSR